MTSADWHLHDRAERATGLTLDTEGRVYAAYVSFTADAAAGVYRVDVSGGDATLFASHPSMVFPNGFAWDDQGTLYVSDSACGGVFRVQPDGTTEPWLQDPALAGDPPACGQPADALSVGANGLVWDDGALSSPAVTRASSRVSPRKPTGPPAPSRSSPARTATHCQASTASRSTATGRCSAP